MWEDFVAELLEQSDLLAEVAKVVHGKAKALVAEIDGKGGWGRPGGKSAERAPLERRRLLGQLVRVLKGEVRSVFARVGQDTWAKDFANASNLVHARADRLLDGMCDKQVDKLGDNDIFLQMAGEAVYIRRAVNEFVKFASAKPGATMWVSEIVRLPETARALAILCTGGSNREEDDEEGRACLEDTAARRFGDLQEMAAAIQDAQPLVDRLRSQSEEPCQDSMLALRDQVDGLSWKARAAVFAIAERPVQAWLRHESKDLRLAAIGAIGAFRETAATQVKALVACLEDTYLDVQEAAAQALGALGAAAAGDDVEAALSACAMPVAAEALLRIDAASRVRAITSVEATNEGHAKAAAALKACVEHDNEEFRQFVAEVLGRVVGSAEVKSRAADALASFLKDPHPFVREAAATGLGALGEAAMSKVVALAEATAEDSDEEVRQASRLALARLGGLDERASFGDSTGGGRLATVPED